MIGSPHHRRQRQRHDVQYVELQLQLVQLLAFARDISTYLFFLVSLLSFLLSWTGTCLPVLCQAHHLRRACARLHLAMILLPSHRRRICSLRFSCGEDQTAEYNFLRGCEPGMTILPLDLWPGIE